MDIQTIKKRRIQHARRLILLSGGQGEEPGPIDNWTGLKFTALEDESGIGYIPSTVSTAQYSVDSGATWHSMDNTAVPLNQGDEVWVRGMISGDQNINDYAFFSMSGSITASGNIMSLYNYANFETNLAIEYKYAFTKLFFYYSGVLRTAPELPATTLSEGCYAYMFHQCIYMEESPVLPAKVLKPLCYAYMFDACVALSKIVTYAEDISATSCLLGWVHNVAETGDFFNYGAATYPSGDDGIPSSWTEHTN